MIRANPYACTILLTHQRKSRILANSPLFLNKNLVNLTHVKYLLKTEYCFNILLFIKLHVSMSNFFYFIY